MKRILIVEDTKEIREEICDILRMEEYEVYEAENGLDGMDVALNKLPDLIVTDILMPIMDGYKFIKELKKNSATENIPVIFLTSKSDKKDIKRGMSLGADDYLIKPLKIEDLIVSVNYSMKKNYKHNNDHEKNINSRR